MKIITLPNILTFIRIALIPCFVIIFYLPVKWSGWATAAIFLLAAITDWFDGFLARKLCQISAFGTFLDPVADKLIVVSALLLLVTQYPTPLVAIPSLIIIFREVLISALREWMAELGKLAAVKVSFVGKVKTTIQMISILILLSQPTGYSYIVIIGIILMYIAVILTLWSMFLYLIAAWKVCTVPQ